MKRDEEPHPDVVFRLKADLADTFDHIKAGDKAWERVVRSLDALRDALAKEGKFAASDMDKAIREVNRLNGVLADAGVPSVVRRAIHALGGLALDGRVKREKVERALRRRGEAIVTPNGVFVGWRRGDRK